MGENENPIMHCGGARASMFVRFHNKSGVIALLGLMHWVKRFVFVLKPRLTVVLQHLQRVEQRRWYTEEQSVRVPPSSPPAHFSFAFSCTCHPKTRSTDIAFIAFPSAVRGVWVNSIKGITHEITLCLYRQKVFFFPPPLTRKDHSSRLNRENKHC